MTFLYTAAVAAIVLAPPAKAQQVTDSAGAKTIRYGARDRAPAQWRVDTAALMRVGGAEGTGPTEFANILGVARLADGRVVVADGGSVELRIFSPRGEFIRSVGRRGQGPGEFDNIINVFRSGDTIAVQDRQMRLQFMGPDGTLIRGYPRPLFPERSVNTWLGVLSDGTGIVQGVDPVPQSTADQVTQTATLGLRPASSADARAFTQIPVFERVRRNGTSVGLFLGAVSRVATMGERVCAGYTISWEVRCFDRAGRPMTRTIRDIDPGPVTDADKAEFREGYRQANKTVAPDRLRTALDMLQFADRRSAFGRFVPSTTGELWVGPFVVLESFVPGRRGTVSPPRPTTWSVIGRDGRWVADAVLPARFSLLDAGADYVAGIELDQDDVESVVVYRLRR